MSDILELFLDEDETPAPKDPKSPEFSDELELLMEEFSAASDPKSKKDALMAMLHLTGRK